MPMTLDWCAGGVRPQKMKHVCQEIINPAMNRTTDCHRDVIRD